MGTAQLERERTVERPRRIMINRGNPNRPSQNTGWPRYGQQQPSYQHPHPIHREMGLIQPSPQLSRHIAHTKSPLEPYPAAEGFWKNMGVHAMWGAGEGMLEMLLGFMRNRRPL
jgi:hypothetical protein